MEASFWHQRWEENQIGFHEKVANPLILKYFNQLSLNKGSRVFIPLCGKTLDIQWLLSQGFQVAGAELSQIAVEQLFAEMKIKPTITAHGDLFHYSSANIDIYQGDLFNLSKKSLGDISAIYDRAALVALPKDMRIAYTAHLREITNKAPQLLICYEYDQTVKKGPPFSINHEEVNLHYKSHYSLNLLESINVPGGLKGKCDATEHVWLLQ